MKKEITELRALMRERDLDVYFVLSGDAHSGEYTASYWRLRAFLSGFTGSAGTLVVTHEMAGLWTDGRYHIQAAEELKDSGITLFKAGEKDVPTYQKFIADNIKKGGKLGFDGRMTSTAAFNTLKEALRDKEVEYAYHEDIAGTLWKDRPPLPTEPVFEHEAKFAGISASEKLSKIREKMKERGYTSYLVSDLTEVAWLLNLRGRDMTFLPVFYAYVLIMETSATLFIEPSKIKDLASKITAQGFTIRRYEEIASAVSNLKDGILYCNSNNTNMLLTEAVPKSVKVQNAPADDIVRLLKAIKTPEEISNTRNAYIKESTAITRLLIWLDICRANGEICTLKEGDITKKLREYRAPEEFYICDSFSTIPLLKIISSYFMFAKELAVR